MAKRLLTQKGVGEITEINASSSQEIWQEMQAKTGRRTVPQIFIGDVHVGGFDDLAALEKAGKLSALLGITEATVDNIT
jgi:glutaredoxin 3